MPQSDHITTCYILQQLQKDSTAAFHSHLLYYTTENIQPLKVGDHYTTLRYSLYTHLTIHSQLMLQTNCYDSKAVQALWLKYTSSGTGYIHTSTAAEAYLYAKYMEIF